MKPVRAFFCRIGWHSWFSGFDVTGSNGVNTYARCRWCGYKGMLDSQGGLF